VLGEEDEKKHSKKKKLFERNWLYRKKKTSSRSKGMLTVVGGRKKKDGNCLCEAVPKRDETFSSGHEDRVKIGLLLRRTCKKSREEKRGILRGWVYPEPRRIWGKRVTAPCRCARRTTGITFIKLLISCRGGEKGAGRKMGSSTRGTPQRVEKMFWSTDKLARRVVGRRKGIKGLKRRDVSYAKGKGRVKTPGARKMKKGG